MYITYKYGVEYLKHNSKGLAVRIFGERCYFPFEKETDYDFSKITYGQEKSVIPVDVLIFLDRKGLSFQSEELEAVREKYRDPISMIMGHDLDLSDIRTRLKQESWSIINLTSFQLSFSSYEPLLSSLRSVEHTENLDSKALHLVVTAGDRQSDLISWNKSFIQNNASWLLIRVGAHSLEIGPYFNPMDLHYCYSCYIKRLASGDPLWEQPEFAGTAPAQALFEGLFKPILEYEILKARLTDFHEYRRSTTTYAPFLSRFKKESFVSYPLCGVCDV